MRGGYLQELQVPGRVPPGKQLVIARDANAKIEYVYSAEITNPDYGKPLDDPGYAALRAKFPGKKFASLKRATNAVEMAKAYPDETVVAVNVNSVFLQSKHREGDSRGLPATGNGSCLSIGQYILFEEPLPVLMAFNLSAIPKGTKILGAQLRLVLAATQFVGTGKGSKLNAYPLRREWNEGSKTNGFACWYGPKYTGKDGGVNWGKHGCSDPETDFFPTPKASTDVFYFPNKEKQETRLVVSLDLSEMVQQWHSGKIPNNGIVIRLEGGSLDIISSYHAEPTLRPALVIAYEGPAPKSLIETPSAATPKQK